METILNAIYCVHFSYFYNIFYLILKQKKCFDILYFNEEFSIVFHLILKDMLDKVLKKFYPTTALWIDIVSYEENFDELWFDGYFNQVSDENSMKIFVIAL